MYTPQPSVPHLARKPECLPGGFVRKGLSSTEFSAGGSTAISAGDRESINCVESIYAEVQCEMEITPI